MSRPLPRRDPPPSRPKSLDAFIIGAGVGGMYALHCLRGLGLSARAFDEAGGVGGTWWWNRYPGARVDFPGGPFYCYTFCEELVRGWDWTETQPAQRDVLGYLDYVADTLDLRRDIQLQTRVTAARFDEDAQRWLVDTGDGAVWSAQFLVSAVGTLSAAHKPDIPGLESFAGECFHTGRWPQAGVGFAGKRVGIIGTGSSGIQAIPIIAREAEHLTVFQRTPQFTLPCGNHGIDPALKQHARTHWSEIRDLMMASPFGAPFPLMTRRAMAETAEQRQAAYETHWAEGGQGVVFRTYADLLTDRAANETLGDFVRGKIREIVRRPEVAGKLIPDHLIATKRLILDDGYYETFNRDNVTLVDLREDPIETVTPAGIRSRNGEHPLDTLVLATGYDAVTGALLRLNPRGRGGTALADRWAERFNTYLGVTIPGFPNLFMIHGPESPSVLFNMVLGAELEAEWIRDCIRHLRERGLATIEPAPGVEAAWGREVAEIADQTLFPLTDSWYTGANIPGKHRQFAIHLGGPQYFRTLTDVAAAGYRGFVLEPERRAAASAGR